MLACIIDSGSARLVMSNLRSQRCRPYSFSSFTNYHNTPHVNYWLDLLPLFTLCFEILALFSRLGLHVNDSLFFVQGVNDYYPMFSEVQYVATDRNHRLTQVYYTKN